LSILLHTCCGPCACYTTRKLEEGGIKPALFFYNPNIHPYQEQMRRLEALGQLVNARNLPLTIEPGYELEQFLAQVAGDPGNRCEKCYRIRLSRTAARAKESGFDLFGTTLLISPYQNRELICGIGHELAQEYGIRFHDEDFRPGFRQSQQTAKEMGLYRQGYCGCIYSEKERYYKEIRR
jgi:epoxyqueuosine reductase